MNIIILYFLICQRLDAQCKKEVEVMLEVARTYVKPQNPDGDECNPATATQDII